MEETQETHLRKMMAIFSGCTYEMMTGRLEITEGSIPSLFMNVKQPGLPSCRVANRAGMRHASASEHVKVMGCVAVN